MNSLREESVTRSAPCSKDKDKRKTRAKSRPSELFKGSEVLRNVRKHCNIRLIFILSSAKTIQRVGNGR